MSDATNDEVPHREVHSRRIRFAYPQGTLDRHYVDGDLVMSHVVAVLSAAFPPGEDFFVRSVRNFRDQITDPELTTQVAGFIGQEVTHGREHRELNRRLQEMGYPTHRVARFVKWSLADAEKRVPPKLRLAYTAALEHYTATIAECLLRKPEAQALLGDTEERWTAELFGPEGTLGRPSPLGGDGRVKPWNSASSPSPNRAPPTTTC